MHNVAKYSNTSERAEEVLQETSRFDLDRHCANGQPSDWLDEAMEQGIRKTFRRLNWFMPMLRQTGLTPRMNAEQMANSNIELGRIVRARELGPG